MESTFLTRKWFLFLLIPLLLVGLVVIMTTPALIEQDAMAIAITFDLLLTIPVFYFFLIRKTSIPKTTVVPVFIVGIVLGSIFLPSNQQQYIDFAKTFVLPLVELSVLTFIFIKVRSFVKKVKSIENDGLEFYPTLQHVLKENMSERLAAIFATEIGVFYFAFFKWKHTPFKQNEFTYHKNSGTVALLVAFLMVVLIETVALHFLLIEWSALVTWILTILSAYTALQVFALIKSIGHLPIKFQDNQLELRFGFMVELYVQKDQIESIEYSNRELEDEKEIKPLSPLGNATEHNVILHFKSEQFISGFYGMKKRCKGVSFFVDDLDHFKEVMVGN